MSGQDGGRRPITAVSVDELIASALGLPEQSSEEDQYQSAQVELIRAAIRRGAVEAFAEAMSSLEQRHHWCIQVGLPDETRHQTVMACHGAGIELLRTLGVEIPALSEGGEAARW